MMSDPCAYNSHTKGIYAQRSKTKMAFKAVSMNVNIRTPLSIVVLGCTPKYPPRSLMYARV